MGVAEGTALGAFEGTALGAWDGEGWVVEEVVGDFVGGDWSVRMGDDAGGAGKEEEVVDIAPVIGEEDEVAGA